MKTSPLVKPMIRWLTLLAWLTSVVLSVKAQFIRTVPTYHNLGVHVQFSAAPPPATTVALALKEEGAPDDYREIHPLSRITTNEFAGSAFGLKADTGYALRLTSAAFPSNLLVSVRTRSELLPEATNGVYHVALTGDDAQDGRSPATAFRTLRHAMEVVLAGEQILLHSGRYYEGDIEVYPSSSGVGEGTPTQPIVIQSAPGEHAILDGTDPDFHPQWELFDAAHGVYRTACTNEPFHAYVNGGHLFHWGVLDHLRTNRWDQTSGYYVDGTHLYLRLPDGGPVGTNQISIPRFTFGLGLGHVSHYQIRDLEFCYYGLWSGPAGLNFESSSSNWVERCTFHHTGTGIFIRRDSVHNTIQQCSFNEWPVDTFRWDAIKQGEPWGSEPYETGGVVVDGEHTANYGNVIRSNRFEHLFDGAHLLADELNPTEDLDFHDNVILNCGDDGMETDGVGSNLRIYNNVISNFLTGISVAPAALGPTYLIRNRLLDWRPVPSVEGEPDGRFHGYPIKFNHQTRDDPWTQWVFLYHNTGVTTEPGMDGFVFNYYWWYWTNIVARNNLFVGTRAAMVNVNEQCPIDFDYDNFFTSDATRFIEWYGTNYATLADFTADTGQETHGLAVDPRFVGPGDLRLRPDSPLIDRGVRLPGINDDFQDAAPDLGAFEASAAPTAPTLHITNAAPGQVTIWWTPATPGFVLQVSPTLTPPAWTNSPSGPTNPVIVPATLPTKFYRLFKP